MRLTSLVVIASLTLAGCSEVTPEKRYLVFSSQSAMGVVERVVRGPATESSASLVILLPAPFALSGRDYIGTRSEQKIDCTAKRAMQISVRGILADGSEAEPVAALVGSWTTPPPNTPLGRMISAVCEPVFAESKATHQSLRALRTTYLKQLAAEPRKAP